METLDRTVEQRTDLHDISWETYEQLLEDLADTARHA